MDRIFYLHFRFVPPTNLAAILAQYGVELQPVFETSFDVRSPISYSDLKHAMKTNFPEAEYTLVKAKAAVTRALEN